MLPNAVSCIKGEVHNVISMMRISSRFSSSARFEREVAIEAQDTLMRQFKAVQDGLQGISDLASVDCLSYLRPFLDAIMSKDASSPITGTALAAVNKFLLYGFIRPEVPRGREAVNAVATAATHCKFESSSVTEDETTLMQILEILRNCIRCPAGHLLSDDSVWNMCGSSYRISKYEHASHLLHRSAESTLAHLVLTIFTRVPEIADALEEEQEEREETQRQQQQTAAELATRRSISDDSSGHGDAAGAAGSATAAAAEGILPAAAASADRRAATPARDALATAAPAVHRGDSPLWRRSVDAASALVAPAGGRAGTGAGVGRPYGAPTLARLLSWLSSLTDPSGDDTQSRVLGLRLVNMVLEAAGPDVGRLPSLVHVAQAELCRRLVQNSRTQEPSVLALTLRVVYTLFASLTPFLKVPLEVFFVSVHLGLAESRAAQAEHCELALESLLEFARDGELMADLFVNYDCDVECTNLFETLTRTLARRAVPAKGERLNSLHVLALEGVLAVLESLSRRCELAADMRDQADASTAVSDGMSEAAESILDDDDRDGTPTAVGSASLRRLRSRRLLKRRFALAARRFNETGGRHDESTGGWLQYARELGVLPVPDDAGSDLAPEPVQQSDSAPTALGGAITCDHVAHFFRACPGLDKTLMGEYLGAPRTGSRPRYAFQSGVRLAYLRTFKFRGLSVVPALRAFLEAFRLPGEAQMIERLMEDFAARLFSQSPGQFAHEDTIFVLSYSIIMLHTDLHNPNIAPDRKMTKADFIRNNRGVDQGNDIPRHVLEAIYDDISTTAISLQADPSDLAVAPESDAASDTFP